MPPWLSWIFEELVHIKEFWKTALGLIVLVGVSTWTVKDYLERTQRSNLESEVTLLKSQVEAKNDEVERIKAQLEDRNDEVRALKSEGQTNNGEVTAVKNELRVRTDEVTTLERELRARLDEVTALKSELKTKSDELVLTKRELEDARKEAGPLPTYSLGGSNVLVYSSPDWTGVPPKLIIFNGFLVGAGAQHCQGQIRQRDRFATTMTIPTRNGDFGATRAGSEWPARRAHSTACPNA